jgi:hypothetical protein
VRGRGVVISKGSPQNVGLLRNWTVYCWILFFALEKTWSLSKSTCHAYTYFSSTTWAWGARQSHSECHKSVCPSRALLLKNIGHKTAFGPVTIIFDLKCRCGYCHHVLAGCGPMGVSSLGPYQWGCQSLGQQSSEGTFSSWLRAAREDWDLVCDCE